MLDFIAIGPVLGDQIAGAVIFERGECTAEPADPVQPDTGFDLAVTGVVGVLGDVEPGIDDFDDIAERVVKIFGGIAFGIADFFQPVERVVLPLPDLILRGVMTGFAGLVAVGVVVVFDYMTQRIDLFSAAG